jgi:hypothetical protein
VLRCAYVTIFLLFLVLGTTFSCVDKCPAPQNVERGSFVIFGWDENSPIDAGGQVIIRDEDVLLNYIDENDNEWHLVFAIVEEV